MAFARRMRISRPTKFELIRLRRRLAIARRIHKILKDRLVVLTQEFLGVLKRSIDERRRVHELLAKGYDLLASCKMTMNTTSLDALSLLLSKRPTVKIYTRSIAGVRAPLTELIYEIKEKEIGDHEAPPTFIIAHRNLSEALEHLVRLSEFEKVLILLGREMERTKRRVNMLEYVIIPRIEATIKYLRMKFEEREREEKSRLKHVKTVLEQRRG